jgi:hypothetical protein
MNLRAYQPRSNLVKDENGDLLANSYTILNRWKNLFSQLLNVYRASDVRQTEIHHSDIFNCCYICKAVVTGHMKTFRANVTFVFFFEEENNVVGRTGRYWPFWCSFKKTSIFSVSVPLMFHNRVDVFIFSSTCC